MNEWHDITTSGDAFFARRRLERRPEPAAVDVVLTIPRSWDEMKVAQVCHAIDQLDPADSDTRLVFEGLRRGYHLSDADDGETIDVSLHHLAYSDDLDPQTRAVVEGFASTGRHLNDNDPIWNELKAHFRHPIDPTTTDLGHRVPTPSDQGKRTSDTVREVAHVHTCSHTGGEDHDGLCICSCGATSSVAFADGKP